MENENNEIQTYQKGQSNKLSKNFNSREFDCHGSGCCTQTQIEPLLIEYLQKIRDHFGKSIRINSGYRCQVHNKRVGGVSNSRHAKGQAADIHVEGVKPIEVARYAESIGIKGIGLYETAKDGYFVHIDTRTTKSFWYGQAQKYRSTFQEKEEVTKTPSKPILKKGSTGEAVRLLQVKLKELGFDCGGIDGKFGAKTQEQVIAFQKERNLAKDGVCGPKTWAAIESFTPYDIKVVKTPLNIRTGPGVTNPIKAMAVQDGIYTIVYAFNNWGKLKNGEGWFALSHVSKI